MRMRWEIVAGAVALGLVGAATSSFAQEVTLRYRWTKGEETRTRMTQQVSTTISTAIPGGPGNGSVESSMSQVFHTIVEDVAADGTATLRQVIESVRMEFNTPLGNTVFDSASKRQSAEQDHDCRVLRDDRTTSHNGCVADGNGSED
jgi:hypothetical protein